MPSAWQSVERTFLIAVRESFIALLPFLFVNSFMALVLALVNLWHPVWLEGQVYVWLTLFIESLLSLFPLLAILSLSFHFAKYLNVSAVVVASISIGSLMALHINPSVPLESVEQFNEMFSDPRVLLLPIITAYLLKFTVSIERLKIVTSTSLSSYLKSHLNLVIPMLFCFFFVSCFVYGATYLLEMIFQPLFLALTDSSSVVQLFIRVLMTHTLWCFGVHGDIAYMMIVGADNGLQELIPNLTISQFMDLFVLFGGSGSTLSLVIAIFVFSKDHNSLNIAKLSLPFTLFNINEILIYGLPIIFNPKLILPFVLLPILNTSLAYLAISSGILDFTGGSFPWVTPALLNGYIASGNFTVVGFQFLLIIMGVFIYLPFVKQFNLLKANKAFEHDLVNKVKLQNDMERISERNYSRQQSAVLAANRNLEKTLKEVLNGELLLYYQPKIEVSTNKVVGFEALIRLKRESGEVVGPYFIQEFEQAGYAKLIDHFVINTLAMDLSRWQAEEFFPTVSINLNPNNILDSQTQALLIDKLGEVADKVEIEVLESAFMHDLEHVESSIANLRSYGFRFLLDDFGTGFSSISLLSRINIDGVKLDRSILENITHDKGKTLYRHTCMLCQSLGFSLVAEGVETVAEVEFIKQSGVDYVQGWLYAKALPRQEAKRYAILSSLLGVKASESH
ncbi:EAL domain-containing protein [Shewanella sp. UCD-KL12]|uniref:EAL domain-containing protein n=1 Tax=Shewanella sp. UCD-KL12 TaxID=1917163 RepID=UPI000970DDA5|nr:EAL domain-containing protein [Shewanella sp. UCD-KL12]